MNGAAPTSSDPRRLGTGASRAVFAIAIFLSAFLLFQIQLIYAKFLLPWFGGSTAVWAACMLFYQLLLLAGYTYAHVLSRRSLRQQGFLHLMALGIALVLFAVHLGIGFDWVFPGKTFAPPPGAPPIWNIVKLLLIGVGIPFFVLSATAPLLQSWFDRIHVRDGSPYWLYSLSNLGSMLALLSYPFVVEPIFRLRAQSLYWMGGFVFFALCVASCAVAARKTPGTSAAPLAVASEGAGTGRRWLWFGLSAAGSTLMLATTNLLTQDIAPIPLLWVLPLAVYLLSFVVVFAKRRLYYRGLFHPLAVMGFIAATIALYRGTEMSVMPQIANLVLSLLAICIVLHGELAGLRPPASALTSYYLVMSAGGAFGGIFVGLLAPTIFPAIWEFHVAMIAAGWIIAIVLIADRSSWFYDPEPSPAPAAALLVGFGWTLWYLGTIDMTKVTADQQKQLAAGLVLATALVLWLVFSGGPKSLRSPAFRWNQSSVSLCLIVLTAAMIIHLRKHDGTLLYRERNFYGALRVQEQEDQGIKYLELMHGRILHGVQLETQRDLPTTYYDRDSGVGLAIVNHPRRREGMRVGAIGLGAGTLAAYSRPGDVYRFYDINPAVIQLARGRNGYFTFVKSARGEVQIVLGDARLSLQQELERGDFQQFDVLVVDAFNGDSIPVHLLTREAFRLYREHLRDNESVIAVHVSNIAVNLQPVVAGLADEFGMQATLIKTEQRSSTVLSSYWILVSNGQVMYAPPIRMVGQPMIKAALGPPKVLWTDDYSNVASLFEGDED